MNERLVVELPMDVFSGRWEELERHGWRLQARSWEPEAAAWRCLFVRAAAA